MADRDENPVPDAADEAEPPDLDAEAGSDDDEYADGALTRVVADLPAGQPWWRHGRRWGIAGGVGVSLVLHAAVWAAGLWWLGAPPVERPVELRFYAGEGGNDRPLRPDGPGDTAFDQPPVTPLPAPPAAPTDDAASAARADLHAPAMWEPPVSERRFAPVSPDDSAPRLIGVSPAPAEPRIRRPARATTGGRATTHPAAEAARPADAGADGAAPAVAPVERMPRVAGGGGTGRRGVRGGVDSRGMPKPIYPPESIRRGEKGRVMVRIEFRADGTVGEIEILEHPGHPRLVAATVEALRAYRFDPATRDGRPVDYRVNVPFDFTP